MERLKTSSIQEQLKNHLLFPPTKAELLGMSIATFDMFAIGGMGAYEKISGQSMWPILDSFLLGSIIISGYLVIDGGLEKLANRV